MSLLQSFAQELPHSLNGDQIHAICDDLLNAEVDSSCKAHFLSALHQRGETAEELAYFVQALLPKALDFPIQGHLEGKPLMDCCGTGGGGLHLVNVSTATALVLASAGIPVVKHGNRGVTKKSGSTDVLTALGIPFYTKPEQALEQLKRTGFTFLHAPYYHPAFSAVAEARKILAQQGHRSVFNLLGPLLNPARPQVQMTGVFQEAHLQLFSRTLSQIERNRACVLRGVECEGKPLGEASSAGSTDWVLWSGGRFEYGNQVAQGAWSWEDVSANDPQESARKIEAVFNGQGSPVLRELIAWNTAFGIWSYGKESALESAYATASELLSSGGVATKLEACREN